MIEEVRQRSTPWLALDKLGLTNIPETVYTLTNLVIIDLRNNNLRLIPDELRHLPNLKQVVLIGNPLESLPDLPGVTIVIDSSIYLRCRRQFRPEFTHLVLDPKTREKDGSSWAEELRIAGIRNLTIGRNFSTFDILGYEFLFQDIILAYEFLFQDIILTYFFKMLNEDKYLNAINNSFLGAALQDYTLGRIPSLVQLNNSFLGAALQDYTLGRIPSLAQLNKGNFSIHFALSSRSLSLEINSDPSPAISKLLYSLGDLELDQLTLSWFQLKKVPVEILRLHRLQCLTMKGLELTTLPDWIGELGVERLSVSCNGLSTLPDSFARLQQLKSLRLDCNPFNSIPEVIFNLTMLEELGLWECEISEIPADILRLDKLKILEIDESQIGTPPPEVASKGLDAIRDYWRQRADSGVDYLYEAKVIILGEAGAGKTSLARKIENPQYKLQAQEKSTEGIDVIRHHFTSRINTKQQGNKKLLEHQFRANIWDFGGQEIYHATHQFFLTRRSVYVLVCDDRKEDTDFSYWLHVVEMLSDASPLLIVQNEKQDRKRDINLGGLRARFSNLKQALATNLETNRGLDQVIQAIRNELESLEHVGVGLPATWKRVRETLEKEEHDFISLQDYLEICQQHGFTRHEDKLQLSGYLHDLGICLHFQNDPLLKNTVVLNPAWGTDAVYRVLDDAEVIAAHGYFTRTQLSRIWSEAKYTGMQDELLRLMMKFQLCYALESGQSFIAPQLLTSNQPSYPWNSVGGLVVRYEYDFLPKGIVTRFIVALHHLIAGDALVWKTGVVLERDGSRAEIIEEMSQRRIRVRVSGPATDGLLAIVDDQLERLHASFPLLKVERYLPCPCFECVNKAEPYGFALQQLAKMAMKDKHIQCHESGEMIDAARLLREVLPGVVPWVNFGEDSSFERASSPYLPMELDPTAPVNPEVFVSYAWNNESCAIVDNLQQALEGQEIHLLRDREEVRYKDSIRDFMRRIGKGKCVVVVISEKYLKSENCMFEMVEIAKAEGTHSGVATAGRELRLC
jgi:Leucine-rich repeat (LRR) protein